MTPVSVHEAFAATVGDYPSSPFLYVTSHTARAYGYGGSGFTYREAKTEVDRLRAGYARAGYGAGHRVALVFDNRPEFFLHFLALNALGAGVVPVGSGLQLEEMRYLLSHSDVCLVVSVGNHVVAVREASKAVARKLPVVEAEDSDRLPAAMEPAREDTPGLSSEAAMLYTSGTTGRPKGCMLSNAYFLQLGGWYLGLGGLCAMEAGQERLITPLPTSHMNAMACSFMAMLMSGGCLIQLDRFHPSSWWDSVRESRASILHYLGVMPAMLLNIPESSGDNFSAQIKFGFGAGVDPRHQERFEKRFGFPLTEAWAMTETGAGAGTVVNREPRHVGMRCIGVFGSGMEYKLVDEQGQECLGGEPGELLVRSSGEDPRKGFFTGYYKDLEATEAAWEDGWFHTGDVVRLGDDGSLFFVDRSKNIVRRSGENIAAVEVEGVLFRNSLIENCAVAPVEDEIRGEEVMACIELKQNEAATLETAEAIFDACRERLAYYKAPGYISFVSELPLTSSQKVKRGEVKKECRERLQAGDCFDLRHKKRRN